MWVVWDPSPSIAAHRRHEDASQQTLSLWNHQGRKRQASTRAYRQPQRIFSFLPPDVVAPWVAATLPLSARGLDLELISRVAGCELAFALPPPLTTPQPCLHSTSLFTRSVSRHPASALWHGNAHRAAMWFDKRAMPRAYINEWILIFFNVIDLL